MVSGAEGAILVGPGIASMVRGVGGVEAVYEHDIGVFSAP